MRAEDCPDLGSARMPPRYRTALALVDIVRCHSLRRCGAGLNSDFSPWPIKFDTAQVFDPSARRLFRS